VSMSRASREHLNECWIVKYSQWPTRLNHAQQEPDVTYRTNIQGISVIQIAPLSRAIALLVVNPVSLTAHD
jgi:hypothetical protein